MSGSYNRGMQLTSPGKSPLDLSVTRVMGVLNVTPDSFSDGGRFDTVDAAVAQAERMLAEGADVIDVGGESTRPGAAAVDEAEQIRRVVPVIERITARFPEAWVSVDARCSGVVEAALDAGACVINDVSAGEDARNLQLAAKRGVPIVLMHKRGEPATMQRDPRYDDVTGEVLAYLLGRAAAAESAGVPRGQVVIDPGIGFGKTTEHNLFLLADLPRFVATGYAVMLGASRKRFLGENLRPEERLGGTVATTILAAQAGVALVRVHDVRANRQALDLVRRMSLSQK